MELVVEIPKNKVGVVLGTPLQQLVGGVPKPILHQ